MKQMQRYLGLEPLSQANQATILAYRFMLSEYKQGLNTAHHEEASEPRGLIFQTEHTYVKKRTLPAERIKAFPQKRREISQAKATPVSSIHDTLYDLKIRYARLRSTVHQHNIFSQTSLRYTLYWLVQSLE
jgi:hypothetical protein